MAASNSMVLAWLGPAWATGCPLDARAAGGKLNPWSVVWALRSLILIRLAEGLGAGEAGAAAGCKKSKSAEISAIHDKLGQSSDDT